MKLSLGKWLQVPKRIEQVAKERINTGKKTCITVFHYSACVRIEFEMQS